MIWNFIASTYCVVRTYYLTTTTYGGSADNTIAIYNICMLSYYDSLYNILKLLINILTIVTLIMIVNNVLIMSYHRI